VCDLSKATVPTGSSLCRAVVLPDKFLEFMWRKWCGGILACPAGMSHVVTGLALRRCISSSVSNSRDMVSLQCLFGSAFWLLDKIHWVDGSHPSSGGWASRWHSKGVRRCSDHIGIDPFSRPDLFDSIDADSNGKLGLLDLYDCSRLSIDPLRSRCES